MTETQSMRSIAVPYVPGCEPCGHTGRPVQLTATAEDDGTWTIWHVPVVHGGVGWVCDRLAVQPTQQWLDQEAVRRAGWVPPAPAPAPPAPPPDPPPSAEADAARPAAARAAYATLHREVHCTVRMIDESMDLMLERVDAMDDCTSFSARVGSLRRSMLIALAGILQCTECEADVLVRQRLANEVRDE